MFSHTRETHSALGPALQAAYKLMTPTGGRVSVFQTQLPTIGVGMLQSREDPNQRSSTKVYMQRTWRIRGCFSCFSTNVWYVWCAYENNDLCVMCTGRAAPRSCYRLLQEAGSGLFGSADRGRPVPFELSVCRSGFIRYTHSSAVFPWTYVYVMRIYTDVWLLY